MIRSIEGTNQIYTLMKKTVILAVCGILLFNACSKSDDNPGGGGGGGGLDCNTVTAKTFAADVSPIIASKCATNSSCHADGSTNGPGPLINYTAIFNARASIRSAVASGLMPKTGSITTAQKNSILCWIDSGAPDN
jgi:hypothetical protein